MNIRLQKYKKNRLAGMNQYNAARAAGYSEATAGSHSIDIEKRVKTCLADAFEQAGLTDKAIVNHALDGMNANKTVSAIGGKDANAGTVDFVDVPDWTARHKYFETVLKLTDKIRDKALIDQSSHHTLILTVEKYANNEEVQATRSTMGCI